MQYTFYKVINSERLQQELWDAGLSEVTHIDTIGSTEVHVMTSEELSNDKVIQLSSLVAGHLAQTTDEYLRKVLAGAKSFGEKLIEDFTVENMKLGITQDGKTSSVRKATGQIRSALTTGSLKDAIVELKSVPSEDKDSKYITDERLLAAVNKIETYLGIPLSTSL